MKMSKLFLPAMVIVAVGLIYYFYFAPTGELGSFDRFDPNSEINSSIVVKVVHERGFKSIGNSRTMFYAEDKNGKQLQVSVPNSKMPEGVRSANKVELLGHLHGQTMTTAKVTIIE